MDLNMTSTINVFHPFARSPKYNLCPGTAEKRGVALAWSLSVSRVDL